MATHQPAELVNPNGSSPVILVCEHATNYIPEQYDGLGLDEEARSSHIAWDLGAMAVARNLSEMFDARLVASCMSRLVYDCNRPPSAASAIPERSEKYRIPGNENLSDEARSERVVNYYRPFRKLLADTIENSVARPVLVTIHSFTPVYLDKTREVQLGILNDTDSRLADLMLELAPAHTDLCVRRNEPYGPQDGVTYTLQEHGLSNQLPNVMLEIVNSEISSEQQQWGIASMLHGLLRKALASIDD